MWRQRSGQLGLPAPAIPEDYGGAGFTFVEQAIVLEEDGPAELPTVAPLVKAYASDTLGHAAAGNIQIHDGHRLHLGHDAHLYLKRAPLRPAVPR